VARDAAKYPPVRIAADLQEPFRLGALLAERLGLARLDEVQLQRRRLRGAFRPAFNPVLGRRDVVAREEAVCGSAAVSERQVKNVWSCDACGHQFETAAYFPKVDQAA
jgi:hypothetical protein